MRVIVYVEGVSDKLGLEALLKPLLAEKNRQGVRIGFFEAPKGDKKKSVLVKVPKKAVNILLNDPAAHVVALPDLYPPDKGFPHRTVSELQEGIGINFKEALQRKAPDASPRLSERFHIHCFDMADSIKARWTPL